jgi:hypothetical protein
LTQSAERNLLKDFKKRRMVRDIFCKLMYRALTEVPPDKYIEKAFANTKPILKQVRQGGTLRGYCFFEHVPGFNVLVLVHVTAHDYDSYPPEAFSDHAKGFVEDLRGLETHDEARRYVQERGFTPKMWAQWMADHGMGDPHDA